MRLFTRSALLISGLLILSSVLGSQSLPDVWKDWLERDVRYIITPKEREIFLLLKSEKERQAFRYAFWAQRDPTPGTDANELRDEHYRRLRYATEYFGRGTIKEGYETDMGRVYIILGAPVDSQRFYETSANTVPIELWQYYGDTSLGFPPAFYVLFYQDTSMGDYRLYSPSFDGPRRLIREYSQQTMGRYDAYMQLREISAELADASLSLIPGTSGDPTSQSPSLSSDMLLANIQQLPEKKVKPDWAEAFARHKEIVTTDYSVQYVGSHHTLFVHQENGQNYLHAVIEPYRISMSQHEDNVYASLRLNAKITGLEGRTVHQEEKSIQIEMTPDEFKTIERRLLALGDVIPLVAGNFKIDLLLRNTNSKEFSSLEEEVTSPHHGDLLLSPLLFLHDEKTISGSDQTMAFSFGSHRLYPNTQRLFAKSDQLLIYFEIYNSSQELETFLMDVVISRDEAVMAKQQIPIGKKTSFLERFPLQDYQPGYYSVRVKLTDPEGKAICEQSGEFIVSQLAAIPRPWSFNKVYPPLSHPYFAMMRAYQYLGLEENDLAVRELEPLYDAANPHNEVAKLLARAHMNKKEFSEVIDILTPIKDVQDLEILELLGKSYFFSGDYEAAVDFFHKALAVGGEIIDIINSIGISYLRMNRPEDALPYFERSLKLSPDQPEIRETVEKIKRKDP
jgi:GWxTD domain-containing protein